MSPQVLEAIKRARARITPAHAWTQGYDAKNKFKQNVPFHSDKAVCWCAAGALAAERPPNDGLDWALEAFLAVLKKRGECTYLSIYNDTHTHEQILQLFDEVIHDAEATAHRS